MTVVAGVTVSLLLTAFVIDSRAHSDSTRKPASAVRARARAPAAPADPLTQPGTRTLIDARAGDVSVAVEDLQSDQEWLWNPNGRFQTASIVKVDILETLLYDAILAHAPLDAADAALAQTMIEASSDTAAQTLWDELGGSTGVGRFDALAGLSQTSLDTSGYWGESLTAAADQIALLRQLVEPGSLLDAASQRYGLSLMENIDSGQNWGVTAGVPAGVTVALKNGWMPITNDADWEINSIGWIDGDGRDYLVAVLTSGDPSEAYGITTIEDIASRVWSALTPTQLPPVKPDRADPP